MYNGIGLSTARGSGTNGYVQRNLAVVRSFKDKVNYRTEEELQKLEAQSIRGPNPEIREHARKRELELRCAEMEDIMREHGYPDTEVAEKVQQFRTMLLAREAAGQRATLIQKDQFGKPIVRETHAVAEAQHEKNAKLKEAFGISEFFVEGSSFDPQRKVKEDAARQLKETEEAEAREAERVKKKEAERKEAVEKEKARKSEGSSAGGTAYGWVHTPSPSPERSGTAAATDTSKKDKKKEKKKKKKRSRDRSSSSEPPKKHKSKKRKRSRSPAKRAKHHKSKDKKKRDKPKKRARSSSTSGPESVSDSRDVGSKAHREIRRRPSSPTAPSSQRGLPRGDPPVHKKNSSSSQPHQQQQRRRHSSRSLSRSPVITPAEAEKARDSRKHSRRARSNSSSNSSSSNSNNSSSKSSSDEDDISNRSRKKKKSRTGR